MPRRGADAELSYIGGWVFAVGLPVSLASGVGALQGFRMAAMDGSRHNQGARALGIAGASLFAVGTVAWVTGITLWSLNRESPTLAPSLSLGAGSASLGMAGVF